MERWQFIELAELMSTLNEARSVVETLDVKETLKAANWYLENLLGASDEDFKKYNCSVANILYALMEYLLAKTDKKECMHDFHEGVDFFILRMDIWNVGPVGFW